MLERIRYDSVISDLAIYCIPLVLLTEWFDFVLFFKLTHQKVSMHCTDISNKEFIRLNMIIRNEVSGSKVTRTKKKYCQVQAHLGL